MPSLLNTVSPLLVSSPCIPFHMSLTTAVVTCHSPFLGDPQLAAVFFITESSLNALCCNLTRLNGSLGLWIGRGSELQGNHWLTEELVVEQLHAEVVEEHIVKVKRLIMLP
ncbi:hypothetical protein Tco_0402071 [Tanacetum coccineum]